MHCNQYGYHCLLIGRNLNMNRFRSNLVCRYYRGLQTELCKFRYHSNRRRGKWRHLIGWNSIMSDFVQISYVVVFGDCKLNRVSFVAMATIWGGGVQISILISLKFFVCRCIRGSQIGLCKFRPFCAHLWPCRN